MKLTEKEKKLAAKIKAEKKKSVARNQSKDLAVQGGRRTITWQDRTGRSHRGTVKREYTDTGVFVLTSGEKVRTKKSAEWADLGESKNVAVTFSVS